MSAVFGSGHADPEHAGEKLACWDEQPEDDELSDGLQLKDYRGTIAERYVGGRLRLHVHVRVGRDGDLHDVCAAFEAIVSGQDFHPVGYQSGRGSLNCYWGQVPVLVEVPEGVEPLQENAVALLYGWQLSMIATA